MLKAFAHTRERRDRLPKLLETVEAALLKRRPGLTDGRQLEAAIGALFFGQIFGYRVLDIMHSDRTRRQYCELLGIESFRDVCPEATAESDRHYVYRFAKRSRNFWHAIAGKNAELSREVLSRKHIVE